MIMLVHCNYCNRELGWKGTLRKTTFDLTLSANLSNPKCCHQEESKNSWHFCSPECIRGFLSHRQKKLDRQITYQDMCLKWMTERIPHEEFMEAIKCEHGESFNFCNICGSIND